MHVPQTRRRTYLYPLAAGLAGLLLALVFAGPYGGPSAAPLNTSDAPDGLKLVPPNAFGFATINLAALWAKAKDKLPTIPELEKGMGLAPADFTRVTFVAIGNAPEDTGAGMVVTTAKAFDPVRLVKFLLPRGKEMKHKDKVYYATNETHGDAVYALRVCPIRGVSLLCDTETRIDPFGGTAD
jgi:hypothetical protein